MELDDLKTAWQTLDRRLERQNALALQAYSERRLDRARGALRPLFWGQIVQVLCGLLLTFAAAGFWVEHMHVAHRLAAGVTMHVYGVLMIAFAIRTIHLIHTIDYAAPVIAIQRQIEELRTFYIRHGLIVGLPWLLLWIPFLMVAFGLLGVDLWAILWANARSWLVANVAFGIIALAAVTWLRRTRAAKLIDDSMTAGSLVRSRSFLDEIARFEQELQ